MSPMRLLRLKGVFDLRAARIVARALRRAGAGAGGALLVDLGHIREFHDGAIALLGQALAAGGATAGVVVRGLTQHQVRLLRYLGVDLAALGRGLARGPDHASPAGEPG